MDNRTYWVDYAKAIGIILMVYGHVSRGIYNAGITTPNHLHDLVDSFIYSFHMPLFFFLSGLFFYNSLKKRGGKKLVFNKIDTIFYPYIIWSVLQGGVEVGLANYSNGGATYREVFTLLWSPRAQFWFLYTLFLIFIVASIVFSILPKKMSLTAFLLSAAIYIYNPIIPNAFILNLVMQNLVFFTFGIIFTQYFTLNNFYSKKTLLLTTTVFIFSQWLFHDYLSLNYTNKGFSSLALALISIFFISIFSLAISKRQWAFLALIGSSSMAIYLMHILAGSGTRIILDKILGVESFTIHLLIGCLISILAPMIALIIINKLKIPYLFSAPITHGFIQLYDRIPKKSN